MAPKKHGDTPEDHSQDSVTGTGQTTPTLDYHQLAQDLQNSQTMPEIGQAMVPVFSLPEAEQIAFLKALGKEESIEAADLSLAIQTLSDNKNVRKEARRRLIQLEGKDIYAEWQLPQEQTLSFGQALERFQDPSASSALENNPFMSELESLFSQAGALFSEPAYIEIISDFLESWAEDDYETAYELLAEASPLRENLTEEAWIARRHQWFEQARPEDIAVTFIDPVADEDGNEILTESGQPVIEVGWSLQFSGDASNQRLPELPRATNILPETGRQWFLTRYIMVQGDDDWYIQDMVDEGARILERPSTELNQQIAEIQKRASTRVTEMEELDKHLEELEEQDEDEDDEEIEADLAETFELTSSMTRLTTQILHYYDALIARSEANSELFERATELALSITEPERAASYSRQWAEHVPEKRGEALRNFALISMLLTAQLNEEGETEQAQRFTDLAESTLRRARAIDDDPKIAIVLANVLVQQDKSFDEAEELLHKAEAKATANDDLISIAVGLAAIATFRENKEMALNHLLRAAHLGADDEELWFRIGSLQSELHQHAEAILSLKQSIKQVPELTEAYSELANIYLDQNKMTQAREVLRDGVEANPDAVDLLANLALIYHRSGDRRSAFRYLEQAEAIDEEDELVQQVRQEIRSSRHQQQRPKFRPKHNKTKKK